MVSLGSCLGRCLRRRESSFQGLLVRMYLEGVKWNRANVGLWNKRCIHALLGGSGCRHLTGCNLQLENTKRSSPMYIYKKCISDDAIVARTPSNYLLARLGLCPLVPGQMKPIDCLGRSGSGRPHLRSSNDYQKDDKFTLRITETGSLWLSSSCKLNTPFRRELRGILLLIVSMRLYLVDTLRNDWSASVYAR